MYGERSRVIIYFIVLSLIFEFPICCFGENSSSSCIAGERKALLKFKASLTDRANILSSWNGTTDCCAWQGIRCDEITGHVISLDLSNDGTSITNMLIGNQLDPSLLELRYLSYLDLSWNNFQLSPIPAFLGSMKQLQRLYLSAANFSGVVPHHLGNLSSLRVLKLNDVDYHLKVDDLMWASNLSLLERLEISYVDLSRTKALSQVLFNMLPSLIGLRLSWSRLNNAHLPHSCANASALNNIKYLDLSSNSLGSEFPCFLQNITSLGDLNLSDNMMNGSIPRSLCELRNLYSLDLSKNYFSGNLPNCWGNTHLQALRLASNELSGVIPDSIGKAGLLLMLHLNNNSLTGQLPSNLKNNKHLEALDVGENKLSGNLPDWIGACLPNLNVLRLRNNNFYGMIPSTFCKLSALHIMDLANNKLTGKIPHCFGNLSGMVKNTGYGFPGEWTPEILCQVMKGVEFEYTTISYYVLNLDLSSNDLVGEIPSEMTNLSALIGLNLSHNHIRGKIPGNIGDLKSLISLDLSSNNLFGTIPNNLSNLNFLTYLNLSHNNLSGHIPTGSQLQTLDNPSIYDDNPGLCGPPLLKQCPNEGASKLPNSENPRGATDEGDEVENILFYGVIISGFITGFWGVIVVLVLKRSWRRAYFQFAEMLIHKLLGL